MARSPSDDPVFRWTPWVVLAFVALWPTVGPAEAVLSLGALASLAVLSWRRFRDGAHRADDMPRVGRLGSVMCARGRGGVLARGRPVARLLAYGS